MIFTEYSSPPPNRVFVTQILCRIAAFYCVCTFVLGSASLIEAHWVARFDEVLTQILLEEGLLLVLLSTWFWALTGFFQDRLFGSTVSAGFARGFLLLQFTLFGFSMIPCLIDLL